jgi:hypothetical protein
MENDFLGQGKWVAVILPEERWHLVQPQELRRAWVDNQNSSQLGGQRSSCRWKNNVSTALGKTQVRRTGRNMRRNRRFQRQHVA